MIDSEQKEIKEKNPELPSGIQQPIFLNQIVGMFQTISSAPTLPPRFMFDQIQIYINGATKRLYCWDNTGQAWHYITFTA